MSKAWDKVYGQLLSKVLQRTPRGRKKLIMEELITELILLPIIYGLLAWWGYNIGEKKGFSPVWSAVAGFCFGLIAIAVLSLRKAKN